MLISDSFYENDNTMFSSCDSVKPINNWRLDFVNILDERQPVLLIFTKVASISGRHCTVSFNLLKEFFILFNKNRSAWETL